MTTQPAVSESTKGLEAQRSEQKPMTRERETIARIIDPEAMNAGYDPDRGAVQNDIDAAQNIALALADAILLALGPGEGWRPISSAPKDGTPILITRPTDFMLEEGWHVVRWGGAYDDIDCVWLVEDGKHQHALRGPDPSHWQPLPSPPIPNGKGE